MTADYLRLLFPGGNGGAVLFLFEAFVTLIAAIG